MSMDRRDFLKTLTASGVLAQSVGLLPRAASESRAATMAFPTHPKPILINITLDGGPDLRHLLPPIFNADVNSFGGQFWYHRAPIYDLSANDTSAQASTYASKYYDMNLSGVSFGLLKGCEWLKSQIEAGKVAIVNNVASSTTRNHSHSLLVWETGVAAVTRADFDRSGWGGRLASTFDSGVLSATGKVRQFCFGPHATRATGHDNTKVQDFADSRNAALYTYEPSSGASANDWKYNSSAIMGRSLQSYYEAKRSELSVSSPYRPIIQHEINLRDFGKKIKSRLAQIELPKEIVTLYDNAAGAIPKLSAPSFGQGLRNVYDAMACDDILGRRVHSLEVTGWDSHKLQAKSIEPKLKDLFGGGMGLDTFMTRLASDMPDAASNVVVVIGGEFGRQLAANGDKGTDHGRGNCVLVIGDRVKGGVYGDMFPAQDIPEFNVPNTDTKGRTDMQRLFAAICEHVQAGSSGKVFENLANTTIEIEGMFDNLFS